MTQNLESEQYTKEINTSRGSASVFTIYLSSMGVPPIEPVKGEGSKTWKGTGESIVGSVAVPSQKARPWKAKWPTTSEASHGETPHRFRTEIAAVDGGDVAVHVVTGSPSGASASGWNHQNRDGVR